MLRGISIALCAFVAALPAFTQVKSSSPLVLDDGIEIITIDEIPGRMMDAGLFSGPLTNERRLEYMPDGKAPSAVNVFLVKIGSKTYLIDAGFGNAIKENVIDPSKIDAIFITHEHGDHVSGLLKEDGTAVFAAPVFINKKEREYWSAGKTPNSGLQKKTAKAYGNRYKTFSYGDSPAPGIVAIYASGHTPGHTAFLIGTGKKKLLIAADFLHAAALQFPNPDECASFDMDKKASIETRKRLIQMSIDNNWLIGGMHLPAPGYGRAKSNGKGGFDFTLGE
ncbi:MAG: MBL fold metallo-hydrolase [Chitinispirillales bacterium]|jgi:glyoxylase-like metal-dependent hydrolase (beta-lactamase superfamily II)|nr:MBL fold metallo-hydrolase [Chitinispirillales bacterium]